MKFNYLANKILKEQESPYEHLYNIIDDYLISRGQTPTLQSIKQLWDQQGKQFGTQENFFKVLIAWSKETGVKLPSTIPQQGRTFEVGDIVTYEGDEDGWVITGIDGNEYALMEIGEEGVFATLEELQAENP